MLRKLWLWLWILEEIEDETEEMKPIEPTREERNQKRLAELWFAQKVESYTPKEKKKYVMFKDSDEEKEKRKNYFRNLIDDYERVKGKQFVRKYFKENIPEKQEHFHGFLRSTHEIMKIEKKIGIQENKNLKKLLLSNSKND